MSCVFKSNSVTIYSGLRGPTILCGRGLHYAHGFVLDPNLDIFWDQRDKVGTLFVNSVNLDLLSPFQNFRLTKSYQNKKSKSLLLLPTVPVFLSFLSGLGIILPCAGIFVEVSANKKHFPRKTKSRSNDFSFFSC